MRDLERSATMIYEDLLLSIVNTSVNKYIGCRDGNILLWHSFYIYLCGSQSEIYFISFSFVSLVKVKLEINLTVNINEALYHILFGKIVRDMVPN